MSSICHFDEVSDDVKSYKIQKRKSSQNNDYEQLNSKAVRSNRVEPCQSMQSLRDHLQRSHQISSIFGSERNSAHSQYNLAQGEALGFLQAANLKLSQQQADDTEAPDRDNFERLGGELGSNILSPEPPRNDEITEHMSDEESEEESSDPDEQNEFSSEEESDSRSYVSQAQ